MKKYWIEILLFAVIFGVLLNANLPMMTWVNTNSDGPHYILSAKYLQVAHNMSQPLFLLLGRLFLFLPFGTDAWRMGFISVLATTGCSVLIYLVVRYHLIDNPKARLYAVIASLIYGGSALVISQSTVIETYALATMLSVWAYYMYLKKRWLATSILLGLGLAVHPGLTAFCWIVLFIANKGMRNWKWVAVTGSFLAFYLYVPLVGLIGDSLSMWGNESPQGFAENNVGMMFFLAGGLSVWDLPKRIFDAIGIFGVSLGLGSIVVVWYYIRLKNMRNALLWLILAPAIYFIGNLAVQTYVYLLPSIAYGAIITGIGLSKMHIRWSYAVALMAIILLVYNANYFDIGRTLDPNLSAQKFYDEELPKIQDGEIYMGSGWTWAIVYLYNKEEGRNIIPICIDILPSREYRDLVRAKGLNVPDWELTEHYYGEMSKIDQQWGTALAIAQDNPNVWTSMGIIPEQYECIVVPTKGNEWLMTQWLGYEVKAEIAWKPSNPYDIITGAIEVSEWKFILQSNRNCRFLISWATLGYLSFWLIDRLYMAKRKKKALFKKGGVA